MAAAGDTLLVARSRIRYRTPVRTLAILLFALTACGTDTSSGPDAPITDGQTLFTTNCSSCHGDGSGTTLGPTILDPVAGYAAYVVRTGRNEMGFPNGGMTPFTADQLSDEQLTAVLDFLSEAPHPTDGAGLYGRFCANCHGANGRTGRVGRDIVREVGELTIKVRFGHGGTAYGARTSYMPAWSVDEISDAELQLIRTYVAGL